ncbi:FG-GAP-like repeat-containing protein [Streptomyces sp. NPDC058255]|uniref:FG-GAP-like repeat-containing protein n=1 Tax=Streptomyces sp. NPDC058255 TaxID=3346407 RepID=UPI0036EFEAC7
MREKALITAAVCAATILGVTGLAPVPVPAAVAAPQSATARTADFNGDGYADLAIGAHTATVGDVQGAGVVTIAYGSATGLRYDTASIISRATEGVPGDPERNGKFREAGEYGDLDGDGYDDLVVHWLEKNMILWGGSQGITGAATTLPTGNYTATDPKLLGGGIGVGDVNGDGIDDFVSRGHDGRSYGVSVLLGPLDRTTGKPAGVWHRDTPNLDGVNTSTLYVGDMTGDGTADVVVSGDVPSGSGARRGVVLKGSAAGLVPGSAYEGPYAYLDFSVNEYPAAFGDLNKDGYQDLVTGYPGQSRIYVAYGGPDGVSRTVEPGFYSQAGSGVPGADEAGDKFGSAVAIGDTDRDGYPDVVIGVSHETGAATGHTIHAGAITVLRGSASGLTTKGALSFTQNAKGIPSTSENEDHFGVAVAVLDADRSGGPEVYVGGNGEDHYKGRVWKLGTGAAGVTGTGATSFHLGTLGGPSGGGNFGHRFAG